MKRRFRIRRRHDFEQVMRAQRVFAGRALVAFARPNESGVWRVGVAVSRKLRGAVRRNRVRRRLREAARTSLLPPPGTESPGPGEGFDVVLVGRPGVLELPQPALEEEASRVRSRLRGDDWRKTTVPSHPHPDPPPRGREGGERV